MVASTRSQNIDGISSHAVTPLSSLLYEKPPIAFPSISLKLDLPSSSLSNLFRSDPPLFEHKKIYKEPVNEFLWQIVCHHMSMKDFLPEETSFCEYTWAIVVYMVIIGK